MAYWAAVQLQASRERLALHCLSKVNGFEVYSPRIKAPRVLGGRYPALVSGLLFCPDHRAMVGCALEFLASSVSCSTATCRRGFPIK